MQKFKLLAPKNIPELLEALKKTTDNSKILAGGTDLVVYLNEGSINPDLIIDISGVNEMKYIKEDDDNLLIGALTTFTEIEENQLVNKYAKCLGEAAEDLGSKQIRNRGTIGGNIGNAAPAGDSLPALMALGAKVVIIDSYGKKEELPIEDILVGPNKTSLSCEQAIIGIKIPKQEEAWMSTFTKLGSRKAVTIAKLSIAMNVNYNDETNVINEAKVGLGAVGKTAFRATRIEEFLTNRKVNKELVDQFVEEMSVEIEDAISGRASMPYKCEAIKSIAYKAFENLFKEAIA
ncbi:MAG: xanthine dehydrogenase family protein subunit M [Tissierellaceae bacterium]|nr:xanthine dehydrogenase family protein subunit M [Tissierellaceae bacterium]